MSGPHPITLLSPTKINQIKYNPQQKYPNKLSKVKGEKDEKGKQCQPKKKGLLVKHKSQNNISIDIDNQYFSRQTEILNDQIFQFSEELMMKNSRNESRQQRERHKIRHLQIFDWMMLITTHLGLNKQTFYRAAFIMKRFMLLEQRLKNSKVKISNVKIYGLASLLISNKFQNINGNFLNNISYITDKEGQGKLNKQQILECQLYILSILKYTLPITMVVVSVIIQFIKKWNSDIKGSVLEKYSIDYLMEVFSGTFGVFRKSAYGSFVYGNFEKFLYLIDFVLIRKLLQLKFKDLHLLNKPEFFIKILLNIVYNMMRYQIQQQQSQKLKITTHKFRQIANVYSEVYKFQTNSPEIERRSNILMKQIHLLNSLEEKIVLLQKASGYHYEMVKNYCFCRLQSGKYNQMSIIYAESIREANISAFHSQKTYRKQDQIQTNLLQYEQKLKETDQTVKDNKNAKEYMVTSQFCPLCLRKDDLKSRLINYQIYMPLYVGKNKLK